MCRPLLPAIVAACWLAALPAVAADCPQRCVHRGCTSSARTKDMVRYTERMATHYRKPRDYRTLLDYPWHSGWKRYAWRTAAGDRGGPLPVGPPHEGSYYQEGHFPQTLHESGAYEGPYQGGFPQGDVPHAVPPGAIHEVLPPDSVPRPVAPPSALERRSQPYEVVPQPATPDRAARPRLRLRGPADGLSSPLETLDGPPRPERSVVRPKSPVVSQ